ncbi:MULTISPECIES: hypothetical protein [unclassified Microcoleus]|uniref:hypothetical protein n=1 Tax=unclassified Microcoleus TaxID=2642155 RepID=UPI002FD440E8
MGSNRRVNFDRSLGTVRSYNVLGNFKGTEGLGESTEQFALTYLELVEYFQLKQQDSPTIPFRYGGVSNARERAIAPPTKSIIP